jgi:hypothetical protein
MSQSRCPLCRLFALLLPSSFKKMRQDYVLRAFSATQHHFEYTYKKKRHLDNIVLSIGPSNALRWRTKLKRRLGVLHLTKKHNEKSMSICGNQIHPSKIDYQLAKTWTEYCRTHHRGYCVDQSPAIAFNISGFRLIDCETRQVCKHTEEVQYVALSYVWGLGSHASTRALPNPASRVIEDAMIVTKKLGFRYLWVDRYCVSQLATSESRLQIASMDRIYADAVLTIVAVAGEGPDYGLPGVSRKHRLAHPHANIGNLQLVASLRPPRNVVRATKWASRGWTFQEAKLSRRSLFFTDEQMVFECACMTCEESIYVPLESMDTRPHKTTGGEFSTTRIYAPNGPGASWKDIQHNITEYTSRKLTNESDNLNAILGIFNSFQYRHPRQWTSSSEATSITEPSREPTPLHHLWDLPMLAFQATKYDCKESLDYSFCIMLAWRSKTASVRCRQFPSWSWAGWKLPKETHLMLRTTVPLRHSRDSIEPVKFWLDLGLDGHFAFENFEQHPDRRGILEKASHTLIIQGHMRSFGFCLTGDPKFPLKADCLCRWRSCRSTFWLDMEMGSDELDQFVQKKWRAINITWSRSDVHWLVVKLVGTMYERIGVIYSDDCYSLRDRSEQSYKDGKTIYLR